MYLDKGAKFSGTYETSVVKGRQQVLKQLCRKWVQKKPDNMMVAANNVPQHLILLSSFSDSFSLFCTLFLSLSVLSLSLPLVSCVGVPCPYVVVVVVVVGLRCHLCLVCLASCVLSLR